MESTIQSETEIIQTVLIEEIQQHIKSEVVYFLDQATRLVREADCTNLQTVTLPFQAVQSQIRRAQEAMNLLTKIMKED